MTKLTEEMVIARTRVNDLGSIRKLNVWGSGLSDIGLLRRMQSVEVLSLSVNKISSLSDFQWCRNLQELYVRRNEIRDLNQVCYLRDLPRLRSLWLDENPCASCELYRLTVLRALPHLQSLDNVPVAPEEVQDALRRGLELCHPEDPRATEVQQQQQQQQQQLPQSADSRQHSPARQEDYENGSTYFDPYVDFSPPRRPAQPYQNHQQRSPPRRHAPSDPDSEPEAQQPGGGRGALQDSDYYDTDRRNANYDPDTTTGYGRPVNQYHHNNIYDDTTPVSDDFSHGPGSVRGHAGRGAVRSGGRPGRADTCSSDSSGSGGSAGSAGSGGSGLYVVVRRSAAPAPSVLPGDEDVVARSDERDRRPPAQLDLPASQRCSPAPALALGSSQLPQPLQTAGGGSRRPVPRVWNSNILSAVLCLIKELDFPSLEVVEVAVRSRMDEF